MIYIHGFKRSYSHKKNGAKWRMVCHWFCHILFYQFDQPPEKRGRKPGISLNGDKIVESMGGIVAEEPAWRGHVGWSNIARTAAKQIELEDPYRAANWGLFPYILYSAFIPNKALHTAWPAAINLTTFSHAPSLSSSSTRLQSSPCYTLRSTFYALHFTHYTWHSTLHTWHHFTHNILPSKLYTRHFTLHTPYLRLYSLRFSFITRYQHPSATFTLRAPLLSFFHCFASFQTNHFTLPGLQQFYTPYLTLYSLDSSPTTRHQHPAPLLSLTPIFSSSSIAFLMFWPSPPMHVDGWSPRGRWMDQGGIEAHRHPIATWYIGLKNDRQGHQN